MDWTGSARWLAASALVSLAACGGTLENAPAHRASGDASPTSTAPADSSSSPAPHCGVPMPPPFTPTQNLQNPTALAVSDSGRVFVAETAANRVSVIETDGTRRVVAGAGGSGGEG